MDNKAERCVCGRKLVKPELVTNDDIVIRAVKSMCPLMFTPPNKTHSVIFNGTVECITVDIEFDLEDI